MDTTSRASIPTALAGLCLFACTTPEGNSPAAPPSVPPAQATPLTMTPQAISPQTVSPQAVSPQGVSTQPTVPGASRLSLRDRLRTERIPVVAFTAETGEYREVARYIQTVTGIPVLITPSARQVIEDQGLFVEIELVAPIPVESMLNFMTSQSEDLDWILRNEVVQITSKAEAGGDNILEVYDIRDLTFAMTEFLPPDIIGIPTEDLERSGKLRTGGEGEDRIRLVEPDNLVDVIKNTTDPEYWAGDSGASVEYMESGYLLINASREMHIRVAQFLGEGR